MPLVLDSEDKEMNEALTEGSCSHGTYILGSGKDNIHKPTDNGEKPYYTGGFRG